MNGGEGGGRRVFLVNEASALFVSSSCITVFMTVSQYFQTILLWLDLLSTTEKFVQDNCQDFLRAIFGKEI